MSRSVVTPPGTRRLYSIVVGRYPQHQVLFTFNTAAEAIAHLDFVKSQDLTRKKSHSSSPRIQTWLVVKLPNGNWHKVNALPVYLPLPGEPCEGGTVHLPHLITIRYLTWKTHLRPKLTR
jgi:hypothetical protein